MHKILLVDDEAIVKIAVQNVIDWGGSGFKIIGSASNGAEALQFQASHAIDAVITDLRMPVMDGVTMIRKLRENGFDGPILALSNYSDYALVRGALTAGAFDYLLKVNMDAEQISHMLQTMASLISRNTENDFDQKRKDALITSQERDIVQGKLREYLTGQSQSSWGEDMLRQLPATVFPATVLTISLQKEQLGTTSSAQFLDSVTKEVFEDIKVMFTLPMGNNELFCLISEEALAMEGIDFEARLMRLFRQILVYSSQTPLITYISSARDVSMMRTDYQRCVASHSRVFYRPSAGPFPISTEQDGADFTMHRTEIVSEAVSCLKEHRWEELRTVLQRFIDTCENGQIPPDLLVETFGNLIWYGHDLHAISADSKQMSDMMLQLKRCDSASSLLSSAIEFLSSCTRVPANQDRPQKIEIQKAMLYINNYYMNKITLDEIANYVGLNREYLSRLFRRETGDSLFQYINTVRMRKAAELMAANDSIFVKEVAAAVGFDNPFFFSKRFKEHYGVSPTGFNP
ncbi:MAG: response regulator [Christensenella sp.]